MKKPLFIIIILSLSIFSSPALSATSTAQRLAGQVVYTAENSNEFWLVSSTTKQRTLVSDYKATLNTFKNKFVGISEVNFKKISSLGSVIKNNLDLAKNLSVKSFCASKNTGRPGM